jgi:hypothetical protein
MRFWAHIAGYTAFVSPEIHSLDLVRARSPFLLAVILLIAARHSAHANVHRALQRHIETRIWPRILLNNYRSVYIVQACMLWATFIAQPEVGEDDQGWTLFSHASEPRRILLDGLVLITTQSGSPLISD